MIFTINSKSTYSLKYEIKKIFTNRKYLSINQKKQAISKLKYKGKELGHYNSTKIINNFTNYTKYK